MQLRAGANPAAHTRGDTDAVDHLPPGHNDTGTGNRDAATDCDGSATDESANARGGESDRDESADRRAGCRRADGDRRTGVQLRHGDLN